MKNLDGILADINSLSIVDESTPGFVQNPRANALLKEATRLKSQGNMHSAIKMLEAANIAISEGETQYTVDTFVKLPLYLQQAGRGQEAIEKLIKLLDLYSPCWGKPLRRDNVGMIQSHIEKQRAIVYDKLRLVLQREQRYEEAIPYALLADTYSDRIDSRVYGYLAGKWLGKERPAERDLLEVRASGGKFQDYMAKGTVFFEWNEFNNLRQLFENFPEKPKLSSVSALLKKVRKSTLLPWFQSYAKELLGDFEKMDSEVIMEIKKLIDDN
ncbi:hypothetical protein [Nodosilinea nodulosa]|uniref:hypothetical protein n=1 Tax=Nodosilinea nodulosa TaxID=416001 RepID=UPI00036A8459|nr:hypothetical protein [Nodosilinea nodulosa]